MVAKKKTFKFQKSMFVVSNKRFYSQHTHVIFTYKMLNGPYWQKLDLNVHFFCPADSIRQVYQLLYSDFEKKKITAYCNTRRYWKQNISKYLKTVYLNRVNLCWDSIQTSSLILENVYFMHSIQHMNILSHRSYRKTQRPANHCFLYMSRAAVIKWLSTAASAIS